jgi:uncharacterized lipoprotein YmbA
MTPQRLLTILLAFLLTACAGSPATRYYVLQANAESSIKTVNSSMGIGPVNIADYLQRSQLSRTDNGRLQLANYDRWGESLEAGVSRVLMENVATLTDNQQLVRFPWRSDEIPHYAIRLHILSLNTINDNATLKVKWLIYDNQNKKNVASGLEEFKHTAAPDYNGQVTSYNALLLQLSQHLVNHLP